MSFTDFAMLVGANATLLAPVIILLFSIERRLAVVEAKLKILEVRWRSRGESS
jgi:hypothetical protein